VYREPEETNGRIGAAPCVASQAVEEIEEVAVGGAPVRERRERVDLPLLTRVKLLFVIVNVPDNLCDAVQVRESPVNGEAHRRAAFRTHKVIEEWHDDRVGLLPIATEEEERMDVRAPTR